MTSPPASSREDTDEEREVKITTSESGRGFQAPWARQHLRSFITARRKEKEGRTGAGESNLCCSSQLWEVVGRQDSPSLNPRTGGRAQLVTAGPARSPRNSRPQPDTNTLRAAILKTNANLRALPLPERRTRSRSGGQEISGFEISCCFSV